MTIKDKEATFAWYWWLQTHSRESQKAFVTISTPSPKIAAETESIWRERLKNVVRMQKNNSPKLVDSYLWGAVQKDSVFFKGLDTASLTTLQ